MLPVLSPDAFVDDADGFARLGECIYTAVASSFENEKRVLEQQLKPLGLTLVEKGIDMGGNCQFDSVAYLVRHHGGSAEWTKRKVRDAVADHLRSKAHKYKGFYDHAAGWEAYLGEIQKDNISGDHVTLQAICEIFHCRVLIYSNTLWNVVLEPRADAKRHAPLFQLPPQTDLLMAFVPELHFIAVVKADARSPLDPPGKKDVLLDLLLLAKATTERLPLGYDQKRILVDTFIAIYDNHLQALLQRLYLKEGTMKIPLANLRWLMLHEIYKSDIVSQMPLPLAWRGGDVDPAILNFCTHVAHAMDGRYAYPRTEFVVSSTALMDELVKHMVDLEATVATAEGSEQNNFNALEAMWCYLVNAFQPMAPYERRKHMQEARSAIIELEGLFGQKLPAPSLFDPELHNLSDEKRGKELKQRITHIWEYAKQAYELVVKALPKRKEGEVAPGEALRLLGKQSSRLLELSPEQAFAALQCVFRNLKDTYDVLVAQSSYSKNDLRMMNLRLRKFINALMQIKISLSRTASSDAERLRGPCTKLLELLYGKHTPDVLLGKGAALRDGSSETVLNASISKELEGLKTSEDIEAKLKKNPVLVAQLLEEEARIMALEIPPFSQLLGELAQASEEMAWQHVHHHAISAARPFIYVVCARVATTKLTENLIKSWLGRAATAAGASGFAAIALGAGVIGAAVFLEVISLGIFTPLAVTLGAGGVALVAAGVTAGGITAAVWRLSIEKSYMDLLRFLASELTSIPSEKQAKLAESDLLTLERYVIEKWSKATFPFNHSEYLQKPSAADKEALLRLRAGIGIIHQARCFSSYLFAVGLCGAKKSGKSTWARKFHGVPARAGADVHTPFTQWYYSRDPNKETFGDHYVLDFAGLGDINSMRRSALSFAAEKHYLTLGVLFFLDAVFVARIRDTGKNDDVRAILAEMYLLPSPTFVVCNRMDMWWQDRLRENDERPGTLDAGLRELRENLALLHPNLANPANYCLAAIDPGWGKRGAMLAEEFKDWANENNVWDFNQVRAHVIATVKNYRAKKTGPPNPNWRTAVKKSTHPGSPNIRQEP